MTILHALVFILILSILLTLTVFGIKRKITMNFIYIILLAILLRLVTIFIFQNLSSYDFLAAKAVGEAVLKGHNIYIDLAYPDQPYLPVLQYIYAPAVFLSHTVGMTHMFYLKIIYSLFDVLNIYILYRLSNKNKNISFLYAVNPGYFLLSAAHGHTDVILMFFLLAAIYFFKEKNEKLSAFLLGLGIAIQTWPALTLLFFLKYAKRRLVYLLGAVFSSLFFVFLYMFLFHANFFQIIHPALSYRGGFGGWGISIVPALFFPKFPQAYIKIISNITVILLLVLFYRRKFNDLGKEIFLFFLCFSIFSISGARPLWLIPFILLYQPKYWSLWIIIVGIYQGFAVLQEIIYAFNIPLALITNNFVLLAAFILFLLQIKFFFQYKKEIL